MAPILVLIFPSILAHEDAGVPKFYCEDPPELSVHDYAPAATGRAIFSVQDGNVTDCDGDGVIYDTDGHEEFALGGARLTVDSGNGVTSGTIVCYGEVAHHPAFGPIRVEDVVFGPTVPFYVGADSDTVHPTTGADCGDRQIDRVTLCVAQCIVTFEPGKDGAYLVFVGDASGMAVGTHGHVLSG